MKERPIIFSAPMVRAILEGRKTQTRRVVKPQPPDGCQYKINQAGSDALCSIIGTYMWVPPTPRSTDHRLRCPYGQPGDLLWVRETWGLRSHNNPRDWFRGGIRGFSEKAIRAIFTVEHRESWATNPKMDYWRPSIFMPRWASRITLEITAIRVERLQDISEEDAKAEGVPKYDALFKDNPKPFRSGYCAIWQSIHGPGSWDANPFVWVLEFKRVEEPK